jgi:C_GCAxxG_C_C family probable redox protein
MESNFISQVQQSAVESFASGLYCAESVVLALAKAQGLESDVLPKVATAFCSGMARTCSTCGALTGAVMGVGLALGRSKAGESVQPAYEATQKLVHEFEKEFGARNCNELLGCDLATPEGQRKFREEKLHEHCARYTSKAAELAARIIASSKILSIEPIAQITEIKQLLSACGLPVSDIVPSESLLFFGCRSNSELVGVVGLEVYGSVALLRSLAVSPQYRNNCLGKALVAHAEAHAASLGVQSLFLLTTTAEAYFSKLGYLAASREDAPLPIKASAQFSGLCPASSSFMSKRLCSSRKGAVLELFSMTEEKGPRSRGTRLSRCT